MLKVMDDRETAALVGGLASESPRDQAIMLLMLHAGLRNGELRALNFVDVYNGARPFSSLAIISGHKSRDVRYVPVSRHLSAALAAHYVRARELKLPMGPDDPLFVSWIQRRRLSARDVQRTCAAITRRHLGTAFHPHALRHTFATQLMRSANIRVVQQLLGHRSLRSTEVYTHPSSDDRMDAIQATFNN